MKKYIILITLILNLFKFSYTMEASSMDVDPQSVHIHDSDYSFNIEETKNKIDALFENILIAKIYWSSFKNS